MGRATLLVPLGQCEWGIEEVDSLPYPEDDTQFECVRRAKQEHEDRLKQRQQLDEQFERKWSRAWKLRAAQNPISRSWHRVMFALGR